MKKHNVIRCTAIGATILSLAALVILGCSSKSTLEDTSQGTVSVTVSPDSMEVGSSSVVEALVEQDGTPMADQVVNFTVNPTNAGYFTPEIDTTGTDGIAASIFTATSSASAEIWATTGGGSVTSMARLMVTQTQAGSGTVSISVSPSLILANGSDTSAVTITVRDQT